MSNEVREVAEKFNLGNTQFYSLFRAYRGTERQRELLRTLITGEVTVLRCDGESVLVADHRDSRHISRIVRVPDQKSQQIVNRLQKLDWIGHENNLTTEDVAGWFRSRCNGLGEETQSFPENWAPAATASYFVTLPIGGAHGDLVQTTTDEKWESNHYQWFNLHSVPLDRSIYRLSCNDTLWVFTRRAESRWEVVIVPKGQEANSSSDKNLVGVLQDIFVSKTA